MKKTQIGALALTLAGLLNGCSQNISGTVTKEFFYEESLERKENEKDWKVSLPAEYHLYVLREDNKTRVYFFYGEEAKTSAYKKGDKVNLPKSGAHVQLE